MTSRVEKKSKKNKTVAQLSEPMQACSALLKTLKAKPNASPFLEPVDWQKFGLPDYPEIITKPMDLGTITTKLEDGLYNAPADFANDVRLVWSNAQRYNRSESEIYESASSLSKFFEQKFTKIKGSTSGGAAAASSGTGAVRDSKDGKKKREHEVSRTDRMKFCELIRNLTDDQLGQIVLMIQNHSPDALNEEDENELEIEINSIDTTTFSMLMEFVKDKGGASSNKKRKT